VSKLPLIQRKIHKFLMLFLGIQFLLWSLSGLYMVTMNIDFIHGDHLVKAPTFIDLQSESLLSFQDLLKRYPQTERLKLTQLAQQSVYQLTINGEPMLVSATSGESLLPFTQIDIKKLVTAQSNIGDETKIQSIRLLIDNAPSELSPRHLPAWQITYDNFSADTLYLSSVTGQVVTKRHNYWRFFDFVWMLHIMDYENREDITNWLLFMFSLTGVFSCLSGLYLVGHRFRLKAKLKKLFTKNKKQTQRSIDFLTSQTKNGAR
jgi:hypothetical protein